MPKSTQSLIAQRVGVDRSLVSRVLSGRTGNVRVRQQVAERIRAVASEVGYRPNAAAQAVKSGRFNSVALLMSTDARRSYLPVRLLDGLHDALADQDMHLTIARIPDRRLEDGQFVPKMLRSLMVDGVVINYTHQLPERLTDLIDAVRLPAIWLNTPLQHDAVYPDNLAAATQASERLLALGHRRIAYFDDNWAFPELPTAHFSVRDRVSGYQAAMSAAGLAPRVVRPPLRHDTFDGTDPYALFAGCEDFTAVLTYWVSAVPAFMHRICSAGRAIPAELSLATFSSQQAGGLGLGFISAMIEPEYEMGLKAIAMLMRKLRAPGRRIPSCPIPFSWHEGQTIGPPAGVSAP